MTFFALLEGFVFGLLAVKDWETIRRSILVIPIIGLDPYHVVSDFWVDHGEELIDRALSLVSDGRGRLQVVFLVSWFWPRGGITWERRVLQDRSASPGVVLQVVALVIDWFGQQGIYLLRANFVIRVAIGFLLLIIIEPSNLLHHVVLLRVLKTTQEACA